MSSHSVTAPSAPCTDAELKPLPVSNRKGVTEDPLRTARPATKSPQPLPSCYTHAHTHAHTHTHTPLTSCHPNSSHSCAPPHLLDFREPAALDGKTNHRLRCQSSMAAPENTNPFSAPFPDSAHNAVNRPWQSRFGQKP